MDPEYGRRYRRLYREHWWWQARRRFVLDTLERLRPGGEWGGILDIGCGDGLFFDELSRLGRVEGVEANPDLVSIDGPYRDRIHIQPFDDSFRPGRQYELILMLDVLEHLPEPTRALRHALRLLRPAGTILVTVPAFPLLWTNHDVLNEHHVRYTRRTFRPVAETAGVRLDKMRYFFHWTWPAKLCIRMAEAILRLSPNPPTLPPPWLNRALLALTRAEQRLVTPLNPPFGTSLMAIGGHPTE